MEGEEKKSKIAQVGDALYSRSADAIFEKKRHTLTQAPTYKTQETDVQSTWQTPPKEEVPESHFTIPYMKILVGAFIFFVLAMGFAAFRFFGGANLLSADNIDILISGPVSISAGDVLPLDIEIRNKNSAPLQAVNMQVEYPDGTRSADNGSTELKRINENIGDIGTGQSVQKLAKAIVFGQEKSEQVVVVSVEYRVSGSNAIFHKEKEYKVLISSSPVNIQIEGPIEVNANQQADFFVHISSNSQTSFKGLLLSAEYPFGFSVQSTNPKSLNTAQSVFLIGDLNPGEKRTVRVTSIITGQDGEERIVKFTVGLPKGDNDEVISAPIASTQLSLGIRRSFIGVNTIINQNSAKEVAVPVGSPVAVSLDWRNNLPEQIRNLSIVVKLTGAALNKNAVAADEGFYSSSQNTITFDRTNNANFGTIEPNAEGNVDFEFATLLPNEAPGVSFGNARVTMEITVLGARASAANQPEILFADSRTVKISSQLRLLARGFRTVGPLENSGPYPLKVDNQTTFTITWTATNSFNTISGARVSATLPSYVRWTGFTSPDNENIIYDAANNRVTWNIGDIRAGTGVTQAARDVSFQVAVTPSITQVGMEIRLVNESTITGTDTASGGSVSETKLPVTSAITSDPSYTDGAGRIEGRDL